MTAFAAPSSTLPARWTRLRPHAQQSAAMRCDKRFIVCAAGRRSGKTEVLGKRKAVRRALAFHRFPDGNFLFGAPTRDHARRLYWRDLNELVPRERIWRVRESDLTVHLDTGARLRVVGLEAFERSEGESVDGVVVDEFAQIAPKAWSQSLRPALDTDGREGWGIIVGRPRGRNHFYRMAAFAQDPANAAEWAYFHWTSATVLAPEVIASARRDLDAQTFRQEYEADFLNFEGRAYHEFDRTVHADRCLLDTYDPDAPIYLLFDFNVKPGVAAIVHEDRELGTCVEGEVWIPDDSNTRRVCAKIAEGLGEVHRGDVILDGDATGGNRGSAKLDGSDWDIIVRELRPVFGDRLRLAVRDRNPPERSRVNAMNARLRSADGTVRMHVCPTHAGHVVEDYEGVTLLEGGSGEIDKSRDKMITHLSDAIGYHVEHRFPLDDGGEAFTSEAMF